MAEAELNSALNWLKGKFGNMVFKRRGKKIFVSKIPTFKGWTKKQRQGRSVFSQASAYADKVHRSPARRASYGPWAKKLRITVRSAAISDFLRKPLFAKLDVSRYDGAVGSEVSLLSKHRFKLSAVTVIIRDPKGKVLEKGEATFWGTDLWQYIATRALKGRGLVLIEAIGKDRLRRKTSVSTEKVLA